MSWSRGSKWAWPPRGWIQGAWLVQMTFVPLDLLVDALDVRGASSVGQTAVGIAVTILHDSCDRSLRSQWLLWRTSFAAGGGGLLAGHPR